MSRQWVPRQSTYQTWANRLLTTLLYVHPPLARAILMISQPGTSGQVKRPWTIRPHRLVVHGRILISRHRSPYGAQTGKYTLLTIFVTWPRLAGAWGRK